MTSHSWNSAWVIKLFGAICLVVRLIDSDVIIIIYFKKYIDTSKEILYFDTGD